jgi:hypothetical protein
VHGADASGKVVLRRKLRRGEALDLFAALPPATVGMEVCGGAHCWGRKLAHLGHTARLIRDPVDQRDGDHGTWRRPIRCSAPGC